MINQTPSDLGKFPVPPSGHPIPRGWFGRLVRFINSLILHGDGQYLTVKHTLDGQTITPTPALLQALGNGGAPPAAGGCASGLVSSVSGGIASVSVSGSNPLTIKPGTNVSLEDDSGALKINANGSAVIGFPDYTKFSQAEFISLVNQQVTKTYTYPIWLIGEAAKNTGSDMSCTISIDIGGKTINLLSVSIGSTTLYGYSVPVFIPIPANTTFTLIASGGFLSILNVYALPCL